MKQIKEFSQYIHWIILACILIFSAFLNFWNVWNQGFSNEYYAAAVKSMLVNPAIIFFNSFDAGGFVTIDKPPVGLWVQLVSALIFGYSGWSLVLPQALAGVGSVFLVYIMVSRPFGKIAGLISAFTLAITPIFVAISRNGTQDGILIFVLLLALFVALKATRERSLPYLLLSMVIVGIGFNIKMIQAFIVVPAILIIYLYGAKEISLKLRAGHLILALGLLMVVSLSWAVAIDMVPANERPYIGGSGDNSVLGLIINYNGINRLENGMNMGGKRNISQMGPGFIPPGSGMPGNLSERDSRFPPDVRSQINGTGGPPGGGMNDTGTPGLFRLFQEGLAGQLSWLIPFALIGLLAWLKRPLKSMIFKTQLNRSNDEKESVLIAMFLWLLPGLMYFSFTTGFWHPYYLATIAPPIAALVGIGAVAMYNAYQNREGMQQWLLILAILVTGLIQVYMMFYTVEWSGIMIPVVLAATILTAGVLTGLNLSKRKESFQFKRFIAIVGIAILFIAPLAWAFTPLHYGSGGIIPSAGPGGGQRGAGPGAATGISGPGLITSDNNSGLISATGSPGMMPGGPGQEVRNSTSFQKLQNYLISNRTGETWILAVTGAMGESSSLIIETGYPVMALGGFSGTDKILSTDNLPNLIKDGKVKYFLVPSQNESVGMMPGGGTFSGNSEIFSWVSNNCKIVPSSLWKVNESSQENVMGNIPGYSDRNSSMFINAPGMMQGPGGQGGENNLYDCSCVRNQT